MDESSLDLAFAEGGREELSEAIRLYGHKILKYCHNILCDYYEAQDAVQITFMKAYEKRRSFVNRVSLSAWLYRIAYTTCIDITRRRKFFLAVPIPDKPGENRSEKFISTDLQEALLTLPPKDRALVFSRVIDELNYAEMEKIYHASAASLRKRYERARKKLAKRLIQVNSYYARMEGSQ